MVLFVFYSGFMRAFLNASEVAKLLNVDRATVTRWIKKGIIKRSVKPGGTQNWRIPLAAYEELIKKQ
jgi:excisionase family DNA binding protein